jgi:hypothetical protein
MDVIAIFTLAIVPHLGNTPDLARQVGAARILPPLTPHGKRTARNVPETLSNITEVTIRARSCLDTLE